MDARGKIAGSITVLLFIACQATSKTRSVYPQQPPGGSICVSSVPVPGSGRTSLANPAGGGRTFEYSVQIDRDQIRRVSHDVGVRIDGLALKRKHLLKIRKDGRVVQSFWFAFEKQGSSELCLWYKSLYETWSLWTVKEARTNCDCDHALTDH